MEHGDTIPKKNRKKIAKKRKSEISEADPEDCENNYVTDYLKIGEANHDFDDSE